MANFLVQFNMFLASNAWFFPMTLTLCLGTILLIFVGGLLHVLNGTRHPFPIWMSIAVIANVLSYLPYAYCFVKNNEIKNGWYYIAYTSLMLYHWVLAHRYYSSTEEMPFVMDGKLVPKSLVLKNKVLLWVTIVLIFASGIFIFGRTPLKTFFYPTFGLAVIIIVMTTYMMMIALLRMKRTIEGMHALKGKLNIPRMLSHALAFIVYMVVYVLSEFLSIVFDNGIGQYFYVSWFLCTIFGTFSYFCFFLIIWHLGTKDKLKRTDVRSWRVSNRSDSIDFTAKEVTFTNFIEGSNKNVKKLDVDIWASFLKNESVPFGTIKDESFKDRLAL